VVSFPLKRYATANNPAVANITSNPCTPFSSDVGIFVTVAAGEGVVGVGVSVGTGVTVGVGESVDVRVGIGVGVGLGLPSDGFPG